MCELALLENDWIEVSKWEGRQKGFCYWDIVINTHKSFLEAKYVQRRNRERGRKRGGDKMVMLLGHSKQHITLFWRSIKGIDKLNGTRQNWDVASKKSYVLITMQKNEKE